jgi:hypothetical protein
VLKGPGNLQSSVLFSYGKKKIRAKNEPEEICSDSSTLSSGSLWIERISLSSADLILK